MGDDRRILASGKIVLDAAIYPFQLCKAILEGLRDELAEWGHYSKSLGVMAPSGYGLGATNDEATSYMLLESLLKLQKHEGLPDTVDSVSGQILPGHLVEESRREEMKYFEAMNVYSKVPEAEAWGITGRRPIGVRWVDTNKGDDSEPNYRSRLVAKDIRKKGEEVIFVATPALQAFGRCSASWLHPDSG